MFFNSKVEGSKPEPKLKTAPVKTEKKEVYKDEDRWGDEEAPKVDDTKKEKPKLMV